MSDTAFATIYAITIIVSALCFFAGVFIYEHWFRK
jgi:hypothetical protein